MWDTPILLLFRRKKESCSAFVVSGSKFVVFLGGINHSPLEIFATEADLCKLYMIGRNEPELIKPLFASWTNFAAYFLQT